MARLPQVGGDDGNWGIILNEFLEQSLADDGSLNADTVGSVQLKPLSVTGATLASSAVSEDKLSSGVQAKLNATYASTAQGAKADSALQSSDTATAATANKIALRTSDGRIKAAPATESDDLITLAAATALFRPTIETIGTLASGTLDLSTKLNGGVFHLTLGANLTTFTLPTQPAGFQRIFELVITQDATGSRTITWPSTILGSDGLKPILSTSAAAIDKLAIIQDGVRNEVRLISRSLG